MWTDGRNPIQFEAFDESGLSLGTLTGNHSEHPLCCGTTGEDRFYGVSHAQGVSAIHIRNFGTGNAGIEVDHLQYGFTQVIPLPAGVWVGLGLFGCLGTVGFIRRRSRTD